MLMKSPTYQTAFDDLLLVYLHMFHRLGYEAGKQSYARRYLARFIAWTESVGIESAEELTVLDLAEFRVHLYETINPRDGYRLSHVVQQRTLTAVAKWLAWMHTEGVFSEPLADHVGKALNRSQYDSLCDRINCES